MEIHEQKTEHLSDEDIFLVERLTSELISRALDLCDENTNCFDETIESITNLPPGDDASVEDFVAKPRDSNRKRNSQFSPSAYPMVRSNSVEVGCMFLEASNPVEDHVTPGWRRSLRRTMSEAALSLVDEGFEVEYLEHFDPFKGSLDVVTQVDEVLATSANKHPAEQTSFMRALEEMSGRMYVSSKLTVEKPSTAGLDSVASDVADGADEVDEKDEVDMTDGVDDKDEVDEMNEVDGKVDDTDEEHGIDEPDDIDAVDGTDEIDETRVVDGDFSCKSPVTTGREDDLMESTKSHDQFFSTFAMEGIHNNGISVLCSSGQRISNESCSGDVDLENDGIVNLENSVEKTNCGSDNEMKLSVQCFSEVDILDSVSLNVAESDHRTNISVATSVIEEGDPHDCTNDRVTDDTNDRVIDDTSYRLMDDTSDRLMDDTNDRAADDTSDRVTNYLNDRVAGDTSNRVKDDTDDKATDDMDDRAADDGCTDESISLSSPTDLQSTENHSTHNFTTSTTHLTLDKDSFSDQSINPKPSNTHLALNSVINNTEDVSLTDRKNDLTAAETKQVEPLDLNETVSDVDGLANLSFLSTDTEGDFSSFSAAEKFVREILSRSRSSSSTSSPRKSGGAAINADSRMYNTLTFLDNDDSDDGEGGTDRDRTSSDHDRKNKTTGEAADGSEKLDNHKHPASDVNDNRRETDEDNGSGVHPSDSEPTAAKKRIVPNLELLKIEDLDLNFSPRGGSVPDLQLGDYYNDHIPDDLDSPDDLANPVFDSIDDWADDLNDPPVEPIPEYTAREEYEDVRNWRPVQIAGISYRIDMRAIEPYKKVLSHGGYYGNGLNAIVVFAACYLPDRSRLDYRYIMDNLFLYVVSVLELLVVEDYMIIYFHAATSRNKVPALRWLKRCYDMIDHRLRKNLQRLLVVHPTFFLKTVVLMTKPFISSKFSSKLHYVRSLAELTRLVPTEYIHLPEEVKEDDRSLNPNTPAPQKKFINL